MKSQFFEPPWEKQIVSSYRKVRQIVDKSTVFDWWREDSFGPNYRELNF